MIKDELILALKQLTEQCDQTELQQVSAAGVITALIGSLYADEADKLLLSISPFVEHQIYRYKNIVGRDLQ